jgi:purine catabolism regulator
MPPTLRQVLALPGLQLRPLVAVDQPVALDRPVTWVAVSELADPRPFLEGGELVLSTGMRLRTRDKAKLTAYVERLVEANVAAFGLGIGLTHDQVPPALIEAAAGAGLPLVEVPVETPFIAISKSVSDLLAAEEYDAMARAFEAQRELTRAALGLDGTAQVVNRLAKHVGGWVAVLDAHGTILHASSAAARGRADVLMDEVAALRNRGRLSAAALTTAEESVTIQPLGVREKVRGYLTVGTDQRLDRVRQSVVGVAVSLLSLALERDAPAGAARSVVQEAALGLLIAGAEPGQLPLSALGWDWLVTAPVRVVVASGDAPAIAALHDGLDAAPNNQGWVAIERDERLIVVVRDRTDAVASVSQLLSEHTPCGGSEVASLAALKHSLDEAERALAVARQPGVRWFADLASEGFMGVMDPVAGAGLANALLGPLEDRRNRGDLMASLRAWLAHNGQWDSAANELGVHRHTLRYRINRVEELLERSLDDPGVRAELWFALELRRLGQDAV